ncbi:MAG: Transposase like protein [Acidobacteria bacterium]|jgi:putative transposase|nr:Transposase like protein [Acidobacteriota bacterium]
MPRIARVVAPNSVHHVLNRGNRRARIFHKAADYAAFVNLLGEVATRFDMRLLAYCLMPNHWHLVLWPRDGSEIPAYMRWLSNTHVRRYHHHYGSTGTGHLYQGRYSDFLVQQDRHLLTVLRYVEANPLRAGLVDRAEHWAWSSLSRSCAQDGTGLLTEWPVPRPSDWTTFVNAAPAPSELGDLRLSAQRGRPFGSPTWQVATAARHGLGFTLQPRGRPSGMPPPERRL